MNAKEKYSEWLKNASAAARKKYGQGVDLDKVKAAVDNLLDVFSEDEDRARVAHKKVCNYISYTVSKYDKRSFPVEKLAIEAIVGKKFSGNSYDRAKALTDWIRIQKGEDACDVTRPSPLPQTKNKIGKVVTSYINQARKDKNNNHGFTKYAFKLDGGYTMYANRYVAVRTKEDWELDAAAYTKSIPVPKLDIWENINTQPSVAVRIDRYQVEVFADLGLQVDFKVAEGLSLYFVASQIMFLFKALDAKSLVFYTPKAKTIEGTHPCYFGSVWYCQNEHGEAVFMPCKHDDNEHPIVCDISKQVQVINGKEVVTMAKTTKVEKVEEVKKEDKGMSKTITTADGEKIPAYQAKRTNIPTNCAGCDRISMDEQGKPFCNFHGPSVDISERGNHGCSYRDDKKKATAKTPDTMTNAELNAQSGVHAEYLTKPKKTTAKAKVTSKATAKVEKQKATSKFIGCLTMEQVRQQYMVLKKYGAEVDDKDYADAFERAHQAELKAAQDSGKYIGKLLKEQSPTEGYREAVAVALQLAKNNGVEVKVEGCYIWISNTKREDMECRNALKGAGFWWARNRKQWYWRPAFLYKKEA